MMKKTLSLFTTTLFLAALIAQPSASHAAGQWVGTQAPAVKAADQDGVMRALSDYKGHWVALYFYPKDNSPGCTTEAGKFRERWADFQKANVVVIGVSTDDVASHKAFATKLKLPYPLLADEKSELSRAFGVLRGFGPVRFASRQTFLIDPEGTVVYHYPDVNTGTHAAQVLADVAKLKR